VPFKRNPHDGESVATPSTFIPRSGVRFVLPTKVMRANGHIPSKPKP
jgi:hypothetical protein